MTIINEGLDTIRDLFANDLSLGKWGSGTTPESKTDTTLVNEFSGTSTSITITVADQFFSTSSTLNSIQGGTENISEFGLEFSSGTLANRVTTTAIAKNSALEITSLTRYVIQ